MIIRRTSTKIDKLVSLQIGQRGENFATVVCMDMTDWVSAHPGLGFHCLFKRPGEVVPQPVVSEFENNELTWTVGEWECGVVGIGYLEVRGIDEENGIVAKSRVIPCSIEDTILEEEGVVPTAFESWINQVLAYKNAAVAAKDDAVTAKTQAVGAKDDAVSEKTAAMGYAENAYDYSNTARQQANRATTAATEATNKVVSFLTQYPENSSVAGRAHVIGELFIRNSNLVKATAAISVGDTLALGTNYTNVYLLNIINAM